ncbi:hypothetical protein ACJIZ3_016274 [Penstemon smallii]|uniref:Phytocyanin domain-containing protein n=1 Tax=Penstemon smallii TaxID=265156 RepID=A0ABD3RU21_9LAMI
MAKAIAFLVLLFISYAAAQTTHIVGGNSGWDTTVNFDTWASGETFATGDILSFTFTGSHAVAEVSQADYQNCNTRTPIRTYTSSPTQITLSTAGTRYFICPRSNHCVQGQRLTVTTSTGSTPSPPPSGTTPSPPSGTTPSPPSGTTPSTPTPSGTTAPPPPPPPPSGGATSILGGSNIVVVGLSVVLVALLGFMG